MITGCIHSAANMNDREHSHMSGPCKKKKKRNIVQLNVSAVLRVGMFILALLRRIGGLGRQ